MSDLSTTVEITIGYLTHSFIITSLFIYNSRNYYRLLNPKDIEEGFRYLQQ